MERWFFIELFLPCSQVAIETELSDPGESLSDILELVSRHGTALPFRLEGPTLWRRQIPPPRVGRDPSGFALLELGERHLEGHAEAPEAHVHSFLSDRDALV